jgi:Luciferase-like monooxygenase
LLSPQVGTACSYGIGSRIRPRTAPWVALSAIAFKTDSLRIGPMITPLSRRRVQKVARETVTLDHLSNGRLTLDVGLGNPDDHRPYGPWPKPSPSPYVAEWHDSGERGDPSNPYGPREIATIYRALRKGREDNKDEPGAADFYYGEMEMRRHDPPSQGPSGSCFSSTG